MMSVVALALLTGLLVVVPPEPQDPPLHSYEQKLVCDQPPCPPTVLDSLKESLHHGYQKTADTLEGAKEFVTERIEAARESVEGDYQHVKDSVHETAAKTKHGMQEKVEEAKHGMHETVDRAATFIPGKKTSLHADKSDPASYILPGVGETMESLKRKLDDGRAEVSTFFEDTLALDSLKTTAEQASTYMPSMDTASSHIQDKVRDMQRSTGDVANDMKKKIGGMMSNADEKRRECSEKLGGFLNGLKETLTKSVGTKVISNALGIRVYELCSSMLEDGEKDEEDTDMGSQSGGSAVHESYIYLMESALKAIDGAKEVFEKAIEGEGVELKEKYMYLAETAKGAVEGAKEVFERAAPTTEHGGQSKGASKDAALPKKVPGQLMTRLKEAAIHTKHRVSATVRSLVRTFYLATFSAAFGVALWVTFFSGHLLSHALPRQQLAIVQSKLFPAYLRVVTGCLVICAIGHMVLHPWPSASWWEHLQHWNFSFSLAVSLCNTLLVEPRITKIMFEKLKIEKEEGRGQSGEAMDDETMARLVSVDDKFKGLHQVASFANLATIAGLSWHLWYLANRLVV